MIESKIRASILGLAVLGVSLSLPLHADITLDYSNPNKSSENMVLTVVNNRAAVQFNDGSGEATRMVFDKDQDKLFMVMDSRQQYMDMDSMMKTMGDLSGMLSGMMKDLPADAKGQLGDLLGGLMGGNAEPQAAAPEAVLTETGASDEIAGFKCAVATLESADQSTELCLAKPAAIGIDDADFAVMQAMLIKQKEAVEMASDMIGMQDIGFNPGDLDRMPLRIKQTAGANEGSVSELRGVRKEVDANAVAIPDNYAPMQMPGVQ